MPRDISTVGYDGSSIIGRDRGSPVIPFTDLEHCAVVIVCGRPRRSRVHETSPGKRRLAGLPAHGGSPQAAGWVSGQIGSSPHKPQPEWSRRPTQTPLRRTRPMRLRSRTYRPTTRRANHLHSRSDSALGARLDMISHRVLRSGLRPTRSNACGSSTLRPRRRRGVMCTSAIAALHPSRARGVMPVAWRLGTKDDRPSRSRSCERTSIVGRFARVTSSDRRPTHGTRTSTGDATASKNEGGP
jgi:hypothetical protein